MESFAKGDRVSLKEPLGVLKSGTAGLVVEVYRDGYLEFDDTLTAGTKDFEFHGIGSTLFDYGVVFPQLRGYVNDYTNGPWLTDKIDLSQFHAGDVIPLAHDELNFIDSELREVMK
jgi:hypothetical protein